MALPFGQRGRDFGYKELKIGQYLVAEELQNHNFLKNLKTAFICVRKQAANGGFSGQIGAFLRKICPFQRVDKNCRS